MNKLERETGVEPATSSLGSWHSTTELLPLVDLAGYSPDRSLAYPVIDSGGLKLTSARAAASTLLRHLWPLPPHRRNRAAIKAYGPRRSQTWCVEFAACPRWPGQRPIA